MADAADLIRRDPGLSARVLTLCTNPVHLGRRPDRPLNLEQDLMLLGPDTVRALAHMTALDQQFGDAAPARLDWLRQLWINSLLTATLAECLAELIDYPAGKQAYLAGLLSNIGQMGLLARAPMDYAPLLEQLNDTPEELMRQEVIVLDVDHATLGATMLRKAGCTGPLADAVRHHHAGLATLDNAHPLVRLVALANRLVKAGKLPSVDTAMGAKRLLGLSPGQLDRAFATAGERTDRIVHHLQLSNETFERTPSSQPCLSCLRQRLCDLHALAVLRQQLGASDTIETLCKTAHIATSLLFGNLAVGFVLIQDDPAKAIGYSAADPSGRWREFVLRLPDEQSRVGSALSTGALQVYHPRRSALADAAPAIIDQEFTTLLGHEGFLALPLGLRARPQGVMLIGIDSEDGSRLAERRTLLALFARELGGAISKIMWRVEQRSSALAEQEAEFRLRARRLAHEIHNPLARVQELLHTLGRLRNVKSTGSVAGIDAINEQISRIEALVRRLTEPVHEHAANQGTHLNEVIKEVVGLIEPALITPAGIRLQLALDGTIPAIAIPRDSVRQILLNLIQNAAEALTDGQSISIHTDDYVYNGKIAYVSIEIADNGPGIPPQVLASIFEPVTSSKGEGHVGVGLSISKQLVDSLEGQITCRSNACGTRFQVLLPRILSGLPTSDTAAFALSGSSLKSYA